MTQSTLGSFDPLAFFARGASNPSTTFASAISPIFSYERSGDPFGGALAGIPGVTAPRNPLTASTEEELRAALEAFQASRKTPGAPKTGSTASDNTVRPPQQTETPGGSADAGALAAAQAEDIRRRQDLQERMASLPYLRELSEIWTQQLESQTEAQTRNALAKQENYNRRKIEESKIQAWQNITTAQINREAQVATSLAQIAYLSNQPNAAVLTAMAPFTQSAAQAGKITVV